MKRAVRITGLLWLAAVLAIVAHAIWVVLPGTTASRVSVSAQQASSGNTSYWVTQVEVQSDLKIENQPIWRQRLIELTDAPSARGNVTQQLRSEAIESPYTLRFRDQNGSLRALKITWHANLARWIDNGRAIEFRSGSGAFTRSPVRDFGREWDGAVVRQFLWSRVTLAALALILAISLGVLLFTWSVRFPRRGRCPQCGYDLRGCTVVGCPECGWNRVKVDA